MTSPASGAGAFTLTGEQELFGAPAAATDPNYYLHNFRALMGVAQLRYDHLLEPSERQVLAALREDERAERLWIRLFLRKGPWFRLALLRYPELPELPDAAAALAARDLLEIDAGTTPMEEVLPLFTVPELKAVAEGLSLTLPRAVKREGVVSSLTAHAHEHPGDLEKALAAFGPRVRLKHRELAQRLLWLVFLTDWQGPGTLVAIDLAHVRFARVPLVFTRPVFRSREEWAAFELARGQEAALWQLAEVGEVEKALAISQAAAEALTPGGEALHPFLSRFSAPWVQARIVATGVGLLERLGRYEEAAAHLRALLAAPWRPHQRGSWWERLSVDLAHLDQGEASRQVCLSGLADPATDPGHRRRLQARLDRLEGRSVRGARAHRRAPRERVLRAEWVHSGAAQRALFRTPGGEPTVVERLALDHYRQDGWEGFHCENSLFTTLFGLLLWDIVFAPIPDVFQTPWQDAPLDLTTEVFYSSRRHLIEPRLEELAQGQLQPWLELAFQHEGCRCRGVVWGVWSKEVLAGLCADIGGAALSRILGELARDYGKRSRGLPDLFLHRPGEVLLVEVKSPRDRLSPEQQVWMELLGEAGLAVELCLIEAEPPPGG